MIEMKETGVLDRIVDGKFAVILFENIGKEIIYPAENLPSGSSEGVFFDALIENDEITSLVINQEKTDEISSEINNRLKAIKRKSRGSRFKRN
jgi:hypothetical protein